jgi:nicotinate phosphoribosyltransferase
VRPLEQSALLTDLYQFAMVQAYLDAGMTDEAVFEFFVRRLPHNRNFLVAAGLEQVLDFLESASFSPEEIAWFEHEGTFNRRFIEYLRAFRFTGDVHAVAEGTIFFADEPIVRVTAPLPQAQLVESRIMNLLNFESMIASKAARCVLAAPGKLLVDFGLRRAHAGEAGLLAARACYLAGYAGTATVLAGATFGIPVFGTMAHSFVEAHATERQAFIDFAASRPNNVTFLIDTYDTEAAARTVAELAPQLRARGATISSVRIDSGDLAAHAFKVRRILDEAGLESVTIFASGGLDEFALEQLVSHGAPIAGFGIGTAVDASTDAPSLDCAYKLQEYAKIARRKVSEDKATWPGRKQLFRQYDDRGWIERDVLTLDGDRQPGTPLVAHVMANGRRLAQPESLTAIQQRTRAQLAMLPVHLKSLAETKTPVRVVIAPVLEELAREVDRRGH